jgi:hypothetical protein
MRCEEAIELSSRHREGELAEAAARDLERHVASCVPCRAYEAELDRVAVAVAGLRAELAREDAATPLPADLEAKLLALGRWHCRCRGAGRGAPVPFGVGDEVVSLGDHLAWLFESEREFDRALGFLEVGLRGDDHAIVFGHEGANARVLDGLRRRGIDPDRLARARRLTRIGGSPTGVGLGEATGGAVRAALAEGAPAVRLLGNLGWGRAGWPSEREILDFESKVTDVARELPLVVLCMYDVGALPGRIVLRGGIECHPLTVRRDALRRNEHYLPAPASSAS